MIGQTQSMASMSISMRLEGIIVNVGKSIELNILEQSLVVSLFEQQNQQHFNWLQISEFAVVC